VERLSPFLKSNNPGVVIGAFKCIYRWIGSELSNFTTILPAFLTLVNSSEPEIQYVALRTISLFVQKHPRLLSREIRLFFCKYNDPSYIKLEKLDILVSIVSPNTAGLILDEFSEYVNAVDVFFVRKTIKCIGEIALKIDAAARKSVDILVGCLQSKADYATEQSIIVVTDLIRKFPGDFESVLTTVCSSIERLKQPEAKAAAVWLIGEFCRIIENSDVLLDPFIDVFHDESSLVQLQILTATVKLYIYKQTEMQDFLQCVLIEATKPTINPDVRTRAYLYWRILSSHPEIANEMLFFNKNSVTYRKIGFADDLLEELICEMGSVAGVLHTLPSEFVRRVKFVPDDDLRLDNDEENLRIWRPVRLNDESFISVACDFDESQMFLRIVNKAVMTISQLAVALNKNAVGLEFSEKPKLPEVLEFGDTEEVAIAIKFSQEAIGQLEKSELQIAIRTNLGVVYGEARIPIECATVSNGEIDENTFRMCFSNYGNQIELKLEATMIASDQCLRERKIYVVGKNGVKTYVSFAFYKTNVFVAELCQNVQSLDVVVKSETRDFLKIIELNADYLFARK
jgi:hypothetical protein